jgi:hypothetical protein
MAKRNPTIDKSTPKDEIVEGVDRLPIAAGINMKALESANAMPDASMKKNDGDNPSVASPAFATGRDRRSFSGGPSGNPPAPGKVGA